MVDVFGPGEDPLPGKKETFYAFPFWTQGKCTLLYNHHFKKKSPRNMIAAGGSLISAPYIIMNFFNPWNPRWEYIKVMVHNCTLCPVHIYGHFSSNNHVWLKLCKFWKISNGYFIQKMTVVSESRGFLVTVIVVQEIVMTRNSIHLFCNYFVTIL